MYILHIFFMPFKYKRIKKMKKKTLMEGEVILMEDLWCEFRHKVYHDLFFAPISFDGLVLMS